MKRNGFPFPSIQGGYWGSRHIPGRYYGHKNGRPGALSLQRKSNIGSPKPKNAEWNAAVTQGKNLPAMQETRFSPWVAKIPWRRKWQPIPVFLPGESLGQRSLVGYSPWGGKESDTNEWLTIPYYMNKYCEACSMFPFICNPNRQIYRDRKYISCWLGLGGTKCECGVMANGYRVLLRK